MSGYIGYTRVSTPKQGIKGVSLSEQRDAISRYAERNQLSIDLWLAEVKTAAEQGRPVFNQAIQVLKQGKYKGIIVHKLDRGTRNLRDWTEIGELSDRGVEIHFVNEGLDLHSRGGRLSADIQAVVATDYIRNLREETRKGFYGRLKQGLYPLRAPIGYLDEGKGKAKSIDPIMGPLVRTAFELYGTARYTLETLGDELHGIGLRNHNGARVTRNGISTLLNNPFYTGIIRIRKTNETFLGIHEPLVRKALFDRVQKVLTGKLNTRTHRHIFQFRRMLSCTQCHYSLIGELQKGHVYYRCHSKQCRLTSLREDAISPKVIELLQMLNFSDNEKTYFKARIATLAKDSMVEQEDAIRSLRLQLDQIKARLQRLTDVYLDQAIDKDTFEQRKNALVVEQRTLEESRANRERHGLSRAEGVDKFLELAGNALLSYEIASPEEKREMVAILTSNRTVTTKSVCLEPSIAFKQIVDRYKKAHCDPYRDIPRTLDPIIDSLTRLNAAGMLPDLEITFPVLARTQNSKSAEINKAWKHDEFGKFTR